MRILYFCPVVSSFYLLFSSPILSRCRLHLLPHTDAGLKRAARGSLKYRTQKYPKNRHLRTIAHRTTLSGYVFATKPRIDNQKKNLLNSNIFPTCPHNTVNVGHALTAEIGSVVWAPQLISTRFASCLRHCSDVAHRKPTKLARCLPSPW